MRPLNDLEWEKLQERVRISDQYNPIGVEFYSATFILSEDGIKLNYKPNFSDTIKGSTIPKKLTDSKKETVKKIKKMKEIRYLQERNLSNLPKTLGSKQLVETIETIKKIKPDQWIGLNETLTRLTNIPMGASLKESIIAPPPNPTNKRSIMEELRQLFHLTIILENQKKR